MSLRPFMPNGMNQSPCDQRRIIMLPSRRSDASNVAVLGSLDMGVPAGAVLMVMVPPSGKGMDMPGSTPSIMGCRSARAMRCTKMTSLPMRSSCLGARNRFPGWGFSADAAMASIWVLLNPNGESASNSTAWTDGVFRSLGISILKESSSKNVVVLRRACSMPFW